MTIITENEFNVPVIIPIKFENPSTNQTEISTETHIPRDFKITSEQLANKLRKTAKGRVYRPELKLKIGDVQWESSAKYIFVEGHGFFVFSKNRQ